MASYRLTFGASLIGALINLVFGVLVAWVLVRYSFPGKRLFDSLVDLPFALPTAVAGIALTTIYAPNGWLGRPLASIGIKSAYSPLGVAIALTFIGLPFVVRSVQPVLEDMDKELEEAAASLGASRWQTFSRVVLPTILPAALAGFAMAFARAVGEYGSVVFISGNMPMRTEITPLLIITKLDQYDYAGATAIAVVMLVFSLALLLPINLLQKWSSSRNEMRRRPSWFRKGSDIAMATATLTAGKLPAARRVATAATGEPTAVRWTLIGVAVFFLALFIFLPLAIVFSQAFAKGIGVYWASLRTRTPWLQSA